MTIFFLSNEDWLTCLFVFFQKIFETTYSFVKHSFVYKNFGEPANSIVQKLDCFTVLLATKWVSVFGAFRPIFWQKINPKLPRSHFFLKRIHNKKFQFKIPIFRKYDCSAVKLPCSEHVMALYLLCYDCSATWLANCHSKKNSPVNYQYP